MKGIVSIVAFSFRSQLAAVHIELAPEWHIYWKNPGDSGMETYLESQGTLLFPVPQKIPISGGLLNYGYEERVTMFVLEPPRDHISLRWLACKADTCVPGRAKIPFSTAPKSLSVQESYLWLPPKLPQRFMERQEDKIILHVQDGVDFFPFQDLEQPPTRVESSEKSLVLYWPEGLPKEGGGLVVLGENCDRGYWFQF